MSVTDENLANFVLLPGRVYDMKGVEALIDSVAFGSLLADEAFDSDWFLTKRDARSATAIIPLKANRRFVRC